MDNESLIGLQLNLKRSAVTVKCCVCCKTEDHDRDPHGCSHMVSVWPRNEHLLHMGNPFSERGLLNTHNPQKNQYSAVHPTPNAE